MDHTNAIDTSKALVVYVSRNTLLPPLPPPILATPLRMVTPSLLSTNNSDAGPSTCLLPMKRGRGRPKGSKNKKTTEKSAEKTTEKKPKIDDSDNRVVKSCPNFNSGITEDERNIGNRELVDLILRRFDGVRRRFCQLGVKHTLTKALTNFMNLGVRTNLTKRIGNVPGLEVGDIFYFWGEMRLVGLHLQNVAGIDYLTGNDGVATSVVTSGHYDDETHEFDTLVYTGHGGTDKNGEARDQKLKRGNLALAESLKRGSGVRVIRGEEDPNNKEKKIYVYDGIYKVSQQWTAKGKTGFDEFKFRLVREPGQTSSAYATWRSIEMWKKNGRGEGLLVEDLSLKNETVPVPVVNDLDEEDKTVPEEFEYTKYLVYSNMILDVEPDRSSLGCQTCRDRSCSKTEDLDCICVRKNGGDLPYHNRILVCRKPSIYECGSSCPCIPDCINRVVQTGLKIQAEVFKTANRGWGLRSLEPIRAGTFICEFAGFRMTREEIEDDDDYVFDSSRVYNPFLWNYEPELAKEEPSQRVSEVYDLPTQILISARRFGNVARFMNHSCSPNVFWQPVEFELNGEFYHRVGFFAMKNIPPLTELTYDYGVSSVAEEVGEDGKELLRGKKVCLCGSVKCKASFG